MTTTEQRQGFTLVKLTGPDLKATFMDLGATLLSLEVRDKTGNWQDVVLGYESLEDYEKHQGYLGTVVGRTANRIRKGQFTLDGRQYQLPVNNGPNCNHGGVKGFSFRKFDVTSFTDDSVTFTIHSPAGEEGYPGMLDAAVTYRLEGPKLVIEYEAATDSQTLVNLTNHTYFNLDGHASSIGSHRLQLASDEFGHVDKDGLFTGTRQKVEGTAFDFRQPRYVRDALESGDPQIETATGLDHPFFLTRSQDAARLISDSTGIEMRVSTSLPACQIYSANYLGGQPGKDHLPMNRQTGICIETGYAPDDINIEKENSRTIVKKGEPWKAWTAFEFDTAYESK